MTLNSVCDAHEHEAGLPARELRGHVLAAALRGAEAVLKAHGEDVSRSAEVIHVALEDAHDLLDDLERDERN